MHATINPYRHGTPNCWKRKTKAGGDALSNKVMAAAASTTSLPQPCCRSEPVIGISPS